MALVYQALNNRNRKVYVGLTARTLDQRIASHVAAARSGSKLRFHAAIRKHGIDAFSWSVIADVPNLVEARSIERELINTLGCCDWSVGYNMREGGSGGWIVPPNKLESWTASMRNRSVTNAGTLNPNSNGISDDALIQQSSEIAIQLGYVPSATVLRSSGVPLPKTLTFRFGGSKSWTSFYQAVSNATGLPINTHYRSPELRLKLSNSYKKCRWYTDGTASKKICDGTVPPHPFTPGRTINAKNH